jgi:hypothetical protein
MKPYHLPVVAMLFCLVGCTDTIDTLTREYRNATNELVDALMMITDEASAKSYTNRVIKPSTARYKEIDNKLTIVRANRTKKEFVEEVLDSNGFLLFQADRMLNQERLALEKKRLLHLKRQYQQKGEQCPSIASLAVGAELDTLKQQLEQPKLIDMFNQFKDWKVDTFQDKIGKYNDKWEKVFKPKVKIG